ncbi:hypothetical protein ACSBR2_023609 [Camellia fascicularis]
MMNLNNTLFFSLLLLFLFFHIANGFNITKLLSQYSDFSTFNSYLTQTQLAGDINSRQTITILVVDNDGMSSLSSKPANVLKKIMSIHVVLDYYDLPKLKKLSKKSSILTTLFQSSGQASGQQGFLNVTNMNNGDIVFGSAIHGSNLGANLVKSVASQPYNVSVLQISTVLIPTGIENSTATSPSKAPAHSPKSAPPSKAPAPGGPAKAPSEAPTADTPGSPPKPAADGPAADAPTDKSDGIVGVALGLSISIVMIIVSTLCFVSMA